MEANFDEKIELSTIADENAELNANFNEKEELLWSAHSAFRAADFAC